MKVRGEKTVEGKKKMKGRKSGNYALKWAIIGKEF